MIKEPVLLAMLAFIGFPLLADSSLDDGLPADATPLTRYRCYTHNVVTPLWYREMKRNDFGAFRYGEVRIRCRIHADGSLSDLSIVVGESAGLLTTVSLNVLRAAAPFKPFDDALIREMGKSYIDEFTFEVLPKSQLSPAARRMENGTSLTPFPDTD